MYNGDDAGRACTVWVFEGNTSVFTDVYTNLFLLVHIILLHSACTFSVSVLHHPL